MKTLQHYRIVHHYDKFAIEVKTEVNDESVWQLANKDGSESTFIDFCKLFDTISDARTQIVEWCKPNQYELYRKLLYYRFKKKSFLDKQNNMLILGWVVIPVYEKENVSV